MQTFLQKGILWLINLLYYPNVVGFWSENNGGGIVITNKECTRFRGFGSKYWQDHDNNPDYLRIYNEYLEVATHEYVSWALLRLIVDEKISRPISNFKLHTWYFFKYRANPLAIYLQTLNKKLHPWKLVNSANGFALAPSIDYPLLVGDEMSINDPIVSIANPNDAVYGFADVTDINDLPKSLSRLTNIWKQALATLEFIGNRPSSKTCPSCGKKGYGYGLSADGSFCPTCFGMGTIYTFGPQQELGEKLLRGSNIKIVDRKLSGGFQPDGLAALLALYDTYHTGVVTDIVQDYLVYHAHHVITQTFPSVAIYFSYDDQPDPGLCDFVHSPQGVLFRHFYLRQGDDYYNLYTGELEHPRTELEIVYCQDFLPNWDRWNVALDIMRNLCKYAK